MSDAGITRRDRLQNGIARLSRSRKRLIMVAADLVAFPVALWSAYALRLAEWWPSSHLTAVWWLFLLLPPVGVFVFARLGLYRAVVRFMGPQAMLAVIKGTLLLSVLMWSAALLGRVEPFPRSVPINFALVTLVYMGGTRMLVRSLYHWLQQQGVSRTPVAIYGAGDAGAQLCQSLRDSRLNYVAAFLDNDASLWGSTIKGVKVYPPDALPDLVEQFGLRRIVLAIPEASRAERKRTLEWLSALTVKVESVPSLPEIVAGTASVDQLRDIELEDLLGREPVPAQQALVDASLHDKVVMVTGAGGSIGSELCRQVARSGPRALVLLEISEFALYAIEQELQALRHELRATFPITALLGSVCDRPRVEAIIDEHGVHTLYHAAAYKHVPIVESNVLEGIRNNILGSRVVAESAQRLGVERCVLISTDKAVRPTSVMGATKRMAELVLQDLAAGSQAGHANSSGTIFCMVRFGNVLGSSGSVVPLFRRQIEEGGPVTVTHPDVTRYFMTIPEAALLVIQAGSMAEGGDVFVLDMGQPVRITELAQRMIQLSGLRVRDDRDPEGDIEIAYRGLRPGEKLYEELLIGDNVVGTTHPKILRAKEDSLTHSELAWVLGELESAGMQMDTQRARRALAHGVRGFDDEQNRLQICSECE